MFRARTMHPRIVAHNRFKYPDMSNYGLLRQVPEKSRPSWTKVPWPPNDRGYDNCTPQVFGRLKPNEA